VREVLGGEHAGAGTARKVPLLLRPCEQGDLALATAQSALSKSDPWMSQELQRTCGISFSSVFGSDKVDNLGMLGSLE